MEEQVVEATCTSAQADIAASNRELQQEGLPDQAPAAGSHMPTRERITVEEFKEWLMQFDTNRDGQISRKELREAIRRRGARFAGLRARFAVWRADKNHNGVVDEEEVEHLIELAERELGFIITAGAVPPPDPRVRVTSTALLNREYKMY